MKQGWELKTLGDVCSVQRGLTYSGKDAVDYSSTVVLRATNIDLDSSSLVFDELKYLRNDFEIKEKYELKKGSLLICFSSGSKRHLGKVALVDNHYKYAFGGFIGQITPNNNINPKYLFYSLISEDYKSYIAQLTDGVNINNLKIKDLQSFQMPTPPLEEQKQIVAKLDQCFEAIDKARANTAKNLENTKELFQSKLNDIFSQKGEGWVKKKLGDAYDVRDGTHDSPKYQDNGFPLITSKNLKNGLITLDKIKYISEDDYLSINKRSKVDVGDILFAMIGTIGNPVVIRDNPGFSIKNVALFKVSKNNDSDFLRYYLEYSTRVMKDEAKGTTQKFVGLGYLRNFTIPLPDLDVQKKVVYQLNRLNKQTQSLESKYQQELNSLEELKKSILQKAFEGEL